MRYFNLWDVAGASLLAGGARLLCSRVSLAGVSLRIVTLAILSFGMAAIFLAICSSCSWSCWLGTVSRPGLRFWLERGQQAKQGGRGS